MKVSLVSTAGENIRAYLTIERVAFKFENLQPVDVDFNFDAIRATLTLGELRDLRDQIQDILTKKDRGLE